MTADDNRGWRAFVQPQGHRVHDHERKRTDKLTDTLIGLVNRG